MMIRLKKAKPDDAKKILKFYLEVIASIEGSEFKPKWSNSYPDLEYIQTSIEKQELYIYADGGNIISSIILNDRFDPEYGNIKWAVNAKSDEVIVIHTFAIDSNFTGKGIGREIFNQIKDDALKNDKKTIRLDIIDGNTGAEKVFRKFGFKYIDSVEVFHEAVGLEKFHLYELAI
jgi:GNAT superfamily N-acetyltransferase